MTGGIAAGLRLLFPDALVMPYSWVNANRSEVCNLLTSADYWICSGPVSFVEECQQSEGASRATLITFPELYFNAFHPDQVYTWMPDGSLLESAAGPYNSAVALWAWQHGLDVEQTIRLFNPDVFESLGYHQRWGISVDRLRHDFTPFPRLDYRDFLVPLMRRGSFMHTVNHPKVPALAQMARILAMAIDPDVPTLDEPIEDVIVDVLFVASFSWPVYPSVANSLGLKGSFMWKREDHSVIHLDEFVRDSFRRYDEQQPTSVECYELKWSIYDQVLLPFTGGK